MGLAFADKVCRCCPEGYDSKGLIADADVFPDGGEIHAVTEVRQGKNGYGDDESVADGFLVVVQGIGPLRR